MNSYINRTSPEALTFASCKPWTRPPVSLLSDTGYLCCVRLRLVKASLRSYLLVSN